MLYSPVLASFADSKLLDFSDPGQLTLRINRTLCVSCYIRHRPNNFTHARGLRGWGLGTRSRLQIAMLTLLYRMLLVSMVRPCSEVCVIIELAVFRGLILFMIDFVSVSVENQIIPTVKQCPECSFKLSLCIPLLMKLYIIHLYENYNHLCSYLPSMSLL